MITIQRVRVRWTAAARGASQANARRGLDRPAALPSMLPKTGVVMHEVLADEATGYEPHAEVLSGGLERARDAGLSLTLAGSTLVVDRLPGRTRQVRRGPARP